MNKFQKAGLAVAVVAGSSFAAGDLWGTDDETFLSLQVQVPDVVKCWQDNQPGPDGKYPDGTYNSPCYETTGGWFYGYAENGGSTLEAYIDGTWVDFGTSPSPQLTDAMGASLIGNDGFKLKYYAGPAESEQKPGLAAFGFNMYKDPKEEGEDVSTWPGLCVTYKSNEAIKLELGWDEDAYNYNTFQANLPASTAAKAIDLSWDAATTGRTSGDFSRETWSPTFDIAMALNDLRSIKFPLKNTGTVPMNAEFTLYEIGKKGTCGTSTSPIIAGGANIGSKVNLSVVGKQLSLGISRAASVQIINLQGAVVHSQALVSSNNNINLANLPAGIYMVRVPALGYVNKIMIK